MEFCEVMKGCEMLLDVHDMAQSYLCQ